MTDIITTKSVLTATGEPKVAWEYKKFRQSWYLPEAEKRADSLYTAAAIAEAESAIVRPLIKREDFSDARSLLLILREERPKLITGINPIFGLNTQRPIVECDWVGKVVQLNPADARDLADAMMSAIEAAISDAFLAAKFIENGATDDEIDFLLQEFHDYRNQNRP